jgi:hypothetical protein
MHLAAVALPGRIRAYNNTTALSVELFCSTSPSPAASRMVFGFNNSVWMKTVDPWDLSRMFSAHVGSCCLWCEFKAASMAHSKQPSVSSGAELPCLSWIAKVAILTILLSDDLVESSLIATCPSHSTVSVVANAPNNRTWESVRQAGCLHLEAVPF